MIVHRHTSVGALVNAYLVETEPGVVAVDSMLTVSDARALRRSLDALGKPLLAVLVTHSHPDHYGGLTELVASDDVPILATQGVHDVIRRDDPTKEQVLRPMFGDEWPARRTFPNTVVQDGERVTFDGTAFSVIDLGPGESPHDSAWVVGDDERTVFLGDQVYDHVHCYLADGFHREWLANIERLRARFDDDTVLYIGHGGPVDASAWGLAARLHRDVRGGGRGGRLVAAVGSSRGCHRTHEGVSAHRRAAVPDGAQHRAARGKARGRA